MHSCVHVCAFRRVRPIQAPVSGDRDFLSTNEAEVRLADTDDMVATRSQLDWSAATFIGTNLVVFASFQARKCCLLRILCMLRFAAMILRPASEGSTTCLTSDTSACPNRTQGSAEDIGDFCVPGNRNSLADERVAKVLRGLS
jgi:hypothetical protein